MEGMYSAPVESMPFFLLGVSVSALQPVEENFLIDQLLHPEKEESYSKTVQTCEPFALELHN